MLRSIRNLVARVPVVAPLYRFMNDVRIKRRLRDRTTEALFTEIHRENAWGGERSVSGRGSDPAQTTLVIAGVSALIREFGVRSVLDIPCGDFKWMQHVDLHGVDYLGADIVEQLVAENTRLHRGPGRRFEQIDLLVGPLPNADLVICRDCLVHLCNADVQRALVNLRASGSQYLLATTFPDREVNRDIATGQWRPLNLQAPPFRLPAPLRIIREGCQEAGGSYADKSLGLWRLEEL